MRFSPLAAVIAAYDLPRAGFEYLINAREFDLEDEPPETLEGLLIYADYTSTPLMEAAVRICGGDPVLEPVQPVAINYALAGILRTLSRSEAGGRSMIPDELIRTGSEMQGWARTIAEEFLLNINAQDKFLKVSDKLSGLIWR
ncbi:MAG: squalene/phytoene synthase family protein [Alphaproteobacteria bacterium]